MALFPQKLDTSITAPDTVYGEQKLEASPIEDHDQFSHKGNPGSQVHNEESRDHVHGNTIETESRRQAQPKREDTVDEEKDAPVGWKKRNLLCFDGGGIRGYWSLLALEMLMDYVARYEEKRENYSSFSPLQCPNNTSMIPLSDQEEEAQRPHTDHDKKVACLAGHRRYLPCHYFDYIFGSSTGALIAIMLGRFRMSVADCISEYKVLGDKVFGSPRTFTQLRFGLVNRAKYNAAKAEEVFKEVCNERDGKFGDDTSGDVKFPMPRGTCKVMVITYRYENRGTRETYPIRTYRLPPRSRKSSVWSGGTMQNVFNGFDVWEVARAAIAAPLYFDEFRFQHRSNQTWVFEDGGYGDYNNPTEEGIREVEDMHGDKCLQNVVSIGTSREVARLGVRKSLSTKVKNYISWTADPEPVHVRVSHRAIKESFKYHRFNQPDALTLKLDDWRPRNSAFKLRSRKPGSDTLDEIFNKFRAWASDPQVQEKFKECAKRLVNMRVARAFGPNRVCRCDNRDKVCEPVRGQDKICLAVSSGNVCVCERPGDGQGCKNFRQGRVCRSVDEKGKISEQLEQRRRREAMWERFASRCEYQCNEASCVGREFPWQDEFETHLQRDHHEEAWNIDWKADGRRKEWFYPLKGGR